MYTLARIAQPLLLIHGTAPAVWGELPALLAERHEVIAYDRRSFGSWPGVASDLTTHAADAAALIRERGGPATLVGWSMGGVIAMEVAATHPELVERLVLLEPPLHVKRHPRPAMVAAVAGATVLGRLGRPEAGARRFLRWALGRRDGGTDLERMPAEWHARLGAGDGAAVVRELAAGTGEHLGEAQLRSIAAPTSVLRGDCSSPVLFSAAQRAAGLIPGARLVEVPGSGHAIQLDAPEVVAEWS